MEHQGFSAEETENYIRNIQQTIRKKLESSPLRWPISHQESLRKKNLRICFGKNLSPYLAIFRVYPKSRQVVVYHIVWERSNYAILFEMANGG